MASSIGNPVFSLTNADENHLYGGMAVKLAMRRGRLVDQEVCSNLRKWIDYVALLLLSLAGVISSFLLNQDVPIPNDLILLLFGTGIISSVILIRTNLPFEKDQNQGVQ